MNPRKQPDLIFAGQRSLSRKTVLAALAAVSLAGTAEAASIGVNYVDTGDAGIQNGASDSLGAAETAGAPGYSQANWNNLGRWGNPTGLNDSSGTASGVNVAWDANNTWQNGAGFSTGDHKLMHSYLDASGQVNWNDTPGATFSGWWGENKPDAMINGVSSWLASVGASSYSVVVYTDGDLTEGRISEYWLQSFTGSDFGNLTLGTDLTSRAFAKDSANFSGTYSLVPLSANSVANAAEGNYIVFEGLTADSFLLRTEERDFRAIINGFQIVATVPEPTSMALLGLGALGLAFARRKS